jgi:hypothetical protein
MTKSEELKIYCEEQLAYLLDEEDFRVEVIITDGFATSPNIDKKDKFTVMISNNPNERNLPLHTADKLFKWNDVKDYIIPFLMRLSKDYDVSPRVYFYEYSKGVKYGSYSRQQHWIGHSLNSIIKDKINPGMIRVIDINVSDKTPDTLLKRIKRFANFN